MSDKSVFWKCCQHEPMAILAIWCQNFQLSLIIHNTGCNFNSYVDSTPPQMMQATNILGNNVTVCKSKGILKINHRGSISCWQHCCGNTTSLLQKTIGGISLLDLDWSDPWPHFPSSNLLGRTGYDRNIFSLHLWSVIVEWSVNTLIWWAKWITNYKHKDKKQ